jgi:hypothetical protein
MSRPSVSTLALLATIGTMALAPASRAQGFVGSFDPAQWTLENTNPDQTLAYDDYFCGQVNDVACVAGPNDQFAPFDPALASPPSLAPPGKGCRLVVEHPIQPGPPPGRS